MKLKYLGLIVPLIVILAVIILGLLNIGFSEERIITEYLEYEGLFPYEEGEDCRGGVGLDESKEFLLVKMDYKNDFFLSKNVETPSFLLCPSEYAGEEGGFMNKKWYFIMMIYVDKVQSSHLTITAPLSGEQRYRSRDEVSAGYINLPANSERVVELKITPVCAYKEVRNESSSRSSERYVYKAYKPKVDSLLLFDIGEILKEDSSSGIFPLFGSFRSSSSRFSCEELIKNYSDKGIRIEVRKD
ncbi:hypothetical protein HZB88_04050 [archaeon]|nr:hypothetical protein [archaeon]